MQFRNVDRQIPKFQNCKKVGRALRSATTAQPRLFETFMAAVNWSGLG